METTDAIKTEEQVGFLYSIGSRLSYLFYSMILYGVGFGFFTTVMVYFKQESMLYHPAVPEEKYRYP